MALGSMNKSMNLPQLQRIAMEFERENDIMEQRQEMMDDAVDDAMDVGVEEEGDEVVEQVLEEIGVDLTQSVGHAPLPSYDTFQCSSRQLICLIAWRDTDDNRKSGCCRRQNSTGCWRRKRWRSGR